MPLLRRFWSRGSGYVGHALFPNSLTCHASSGYDTLWFGGSLLRTPRFVQRSISRRSAPLAMRRPQCDAVIKLACISTIRLCAATAPQHIDQPRRVRPMVNRMLQNAGVHGAVSSINASTSSVYGVSGFSRGYSRIIQSPADRYTPAPSGVRAAAASVGQARFSSGFTILPAHVRLCAPAAPRSTVQQLDQSALNRPITVFGGHKAARTSHPGQGRCYKLLLSRSGQQIDRETSTAAIKNFVRHADSRDREADGRFRVFARAPIAIDIANSDDSAQLRINAR